VGDLDARVIVSARFAPILRFYVWRQAREKMTIRIPVRSVLWAEQQFDSKNCISAEGRFQSLKGKSWECTSIEIA
jgi:hypothetical protein